MNKRITKKTLMVLTIVSIVGLGTYAFAGWGMGKGPGGWGHHGPGMHHQGWGGSGYGHPMNYLTSEEIDALEKERESFYIATEDLRQEVYAKRLELRSELIKDNPDASRAVALQKDISKLQSNLDQRRLEHMIKMRKINPNVGREFMAGYHMGYGYSSSDPCLR